MSKLTFGDLKGKQIAAELHRNQQRQKRLFDEQVASAKARLVYCANLPTMEADIRAYPEIVRSYTIQVLREALRLELDRRARS